MRKYLHPTNAERRSARDHHSACPNASYVEWDCGCHTMKDCQACSHGLQCTICKQTFVTEAVRDIPVAPKPVAESTAPTPKEAVAILRKHVSKMPPAESEAVLVLIDHILRLEQYGQLLRNAFRSAEADRPADAVSGTR